MKFPPWNKNETQWKAKGWTPQGPPLPRRPQPSSLPALAKPLLLATEKEKKKKTKWKHFCPHLWSWLLNKTHYHYLLRTQDNLHPQPPVQTVRQGHLVGIPYSSVLLDTCYLLPFWWVWLSTLRVWSADWHISERFNYGERPVLNVGCCTRWAMVLYWIKMEKAGS